MMENLINVSVFPIFVVLFPSSIETHLVSNGKPSSIDSQMLIPDWLT